MEYVLARQIDYQHFLLSREARRNERRRQRELSKRDKVNAMEMGNGPAASKVCCLFIHICYKKTRQLLFIDNQKASKSCIKYQF